MLANGPVYAWHDFDACTGSAERMLSGLSNGSSLVGDMTAPSALNHMQVMAQRSL